MNAHHPWWNSQIETPKRADEIVQIMETNNFSLLNESDIATFYYRNGKGTSIIDLAFTSQTILDSVINWAVDDNASTGSDHATIHLDILAQSELITTDSNTIRYN
jgi:hypothetical protein